MKRNGTLSFLMTLLLSTLLVVGIRVAPSAAVECDDSCIPCHGGFDNVHENFDHAASPGSGAVVLFPDSGHDSGGWAGDKPYFDVTVDCTICHHNLLPVVHGYDCATCHPTPYDTLGLWGRGCQQGGCHAFYHQDSSKAHGTFENPFDPANDCSRCHDSSWAVPQTKCLNCHASTDPEDVTPPVSTTNAQSSYVGPARIAFSITDNGKVGIGRTFYRLDGGPATAAGKTVLITAPGSHNLEFWSMDQYGNTEVSPNTVTFTIVEDTTPPATTSDAQASYEQGGTITLSASDSSTLGVKTTYYRLNEGATQTGTKVVLPATSGTVDYTLTFWSEDWAGNTETQNSVTFTVTSGTGVLRLAWGSSDVNGSPCPGDPDAWASWTVGKVGSGTVVASGVGGCPNWSGVNDVIVPSSPLPYYVIIDWWDSYFEDYAQTRFPSVYVTTPGQVQLLNY
jgi:hypothetical protein